MISEELLKEVESLIRKIIEDDETKRSPEMIRALTELLKALNLFTY